MMSLKLEGVVQIGPGTWTAQLEPSDVRRFGQNASSNGFRSILAVSSPVFDKETGTMAVSLDAVSAMNIGRGNDALLVDLDSGENIKPEANVSSQADAPERDQAFIAACKVHLPAHMVSIIARVLSEVRRHHDDRLVEGAGRKWTAAPHNFLAITIQNRNQQFLVSVKADPARHSFKHIQLKRSRSPYCEFHVNSPSQIEETVQIILASARY
ncbi:MAG: hypothetical protein JNN06_10835 [Gemmobacter sp.]|uniref:hypothetical protein n=1 Tax=Gemmobacter sp. TaxID=1898957 RepID=UPI001A3C6727|nr:hypothetical protein [Gemmobacter sp.]MBL8562764.1 hypothetical protein [Gemmobacter sp.]